MEFIKKNKYILILLLLFALSVLFFSSQYLFNWDAGQFALGTENFNLSKHQPHPPGYFLFVYSAKALNYIFSNINLSFLIINFIAAGLAVYFFFKLILLISENPKTAFIITLLFIVNPVFWFYHNIANTYTFEALSIILTAFFTYKAILGHKNTLIFNLGALALLSGFRPSIVFFALPLLIIQFIFAKQKIKNLLLGALTFIIIFSAWFFPFLTAINGFEQGFEITKNQLWQSAITASQKAQLIFLVKSLIFSFNIILLFLIFYLKKNIKFIIEKKLYFFLISACLSCVFYTFVHIGEVGYTLSIIPLFYLFIILPVQKLSGKNWGLTFIILFIIAQILFFISPQSIFNNEKIEDTNYSTIKKHDQRIKNYVNFIKEKDPAETLIIILRGQYFDRDKNVKIYEFQDIRILSYYLSEYKIYDFPGNYAEYIKMNNFQTKKIYSNEIPISKNKKTVYIIADYIHPDELPQNIEIDKKKIPNSEQIYYTGNMENIDKFEFKRFIFQKPNP